MPPPAGAATLVPADVTAGATDAELVAWLSPHADAPILEFGDLAGRLAGERAADAGAGSAAGPASASAASASASAPASASASAALSARTSRGVRYREEIVRHVKQQVDAAAPFDCLCLQARARVTTPRA